MPNTLVHFGVQGIASKALVPDIDLKWVFLGCIIPDVPWITQRILRFLMPGIDLYDLRSYAIVQATLAFCLILAGALAALSEKPRLAFVILALNSFFHLALDAMEIKWGNGVHFFAPYSWELVNFGYVWPESWVVYLFTVIGLIFSIWVLKYPTHQSIKISLSSSTRIALTGVLLVTYFTAPIAFMHEPEGVDNHSISTLRKKENRLGKKVALDRNLYIKYDSRDSIKTFAGEEIAVVGNKSATGGAVSIKGEFLDHNVMKVTAIHHHNTFLRDMFSYIGLLLMAGIWGRTFILDKNNFK